MSQEEVHQRSFYQGDGLHAHDQIVILVSRWNAEITQALLKGAKQVLASTGVPDICITIKEVPGTFELPLGASWALEHLQPDAVICLGCVIQGETRHFDFICDSVAQGIQRVALDYQKPVIFGILTTQNQAQAMERAGGKIGNKGEEAAVAALEMLDLRRGLSSR